MSDLTTISVQAFYESHLPQTYANVEAPPAPYAFTHIIDGVAYSALVTTDGSVEVMEGSAEAPLMTTTLTEDMWREVVVGAVSANSVLPFPGRLTLAKLEKARALKGTMELTLTRDGEPWTGAVVFNGTPTPVVKLTVTTENFAAMERGELNSQAAFMSGKIKFQGDMGLLMKLGALLG